MTKVQLLLVVSVAQQARRDQWAQLPQRDLLPVWVQPESLPVLRLSAA